MTFLPIVARELRVAARRAGTYWSRLLVALIAIFIGIGLIIADAGASQQVLGQQMFYLLAVLSIGYCLLAGRISTADCLSSEKREGTLGLLFLTDLKGHDVVFGKLAATSLSALYALLAIFPVLAIPLLLGGITNGEFWRVVLVLMNTFLFSLAIGIFVSALSRDARRAIGANFFLLLLFTLGLPAVGWGIGYFFKLRAPGPLLEVLFFPCPIFSGYLALDNPYTLHSKDFWWSVGVIQGLTWLFILLASWIVPRSWQDKPLAPARTAKTSWRDLWHRWSYGNPQHKDSFRKRLLDINAFYWLAGRARLKPVHVWTFLGLAGCWWLWGRLATGGLWLDEAVNLTMALILNSTLKLWIALEAGQRLADDQKMGALELLLTTPLSVRDIVKGQLLALRRQFLKPVLAVIVVELILMELSLDHPSTDKTQVVATFVAGILMLVCDMIALSWVAMSKALAAKSLNRAIIATIIRVLILPWIGFGIAALAVNLWYVLWSRNGWTPGWEFYLGWWFGLGIFTDLFFGLIARWRLQHHFRRFAMRHHDPLPSRFAWLVNHLKAVMTEPKAAEPVEEPSQPVDRPIAGKRRKRIVAGFAFALILLIVCGSFLFHKSHSAFPPPLVVSVDFSKGPLQVFPGVSGAFFVLPDGSLWRWGQPGASKFPRAVLPEQIGTNLDWIQAVEAYDHCVGLRSDGTIWEWGWRGGNYFSSIPELVDQGHDWTGIAAGQRHAVAVRRDGTLWAWGENSGNQLGIGPGPSQTNLVQVGADHNWAVARCQWGCTLAVRTDGTLWLWGQVPRFAGSQASMTNLPFPTQLCRETNWVGFAADSFPLQARTRSGEQWVPFNGPPNADQAMTSACRLILSNSVPDHNAFAFTGVPVLYEVRADGTLWEQTFAIGSMGFWNFTPAGNPQQFGKRSDWVSIWGGGGTAYGLTSDSTIWMWGQDPSQDPTIKFSDRIQLLQREIKSALGTPTPGVGGIPRTLPFQKEPRPLMRLVPAGSKTGTLAR